MPLVPIVLGLGAAVALAGGFVLQQHVAAMEPPEERLSFSLLVHLAHRPVWLLGIAVMVVGQLLGAAALDAGGLAVVEPMLAANLLFALPMAAAWSRQRLGAREWLGAVLLAAGLAVFVAVGDPSGGNATRLPWPNWAIAGLAVGAVVAALVLAARHTTVAEEATLLATGAGVLYGLQDALTRRTLAGLDGNSALGLLASWPAWSLVAVAIVGLLLGQSAFEAAPLAASLPAITIAEPVTGIAFGVGVYGEQLNLAPAALAVELVAFGAAVVGVFLVARSPLVTGEARRQRDQQRDLAGAA